MPSTGRIEHPYDVTSNDSLFPQLRLPAALVRDLRRLNPWWEGQPSRQLPSTQRHLVKQIRRRLTSQLAPIVVVRGPRQIGKTTAQMHVVQQLLGEGIHPRHVLRVQFDESEGLRKLDSPILRIVDWYEQAVLGRTLNQVAEDGASTLLVFDEVQNLAEWAPQLKFLVDTSTTQVLVTGSSALRIEMGRDSLAGRISTIDAGVLSLTEVARFRGENLGDPFLADNGLEPLTKPEFWRELVVHGNSNAEIRDRAFSRFSERGGYPLVHRSDEPWGIIADQLNETVIKRVIQHDLRIGERGRKRDPELLEEVFRLACRYVGQSPSNALLARECNRALNAAVGDQRIANYLRFLGDSLLLRLVEPLEIRLKKKRGNAKVCLADHGLLASWLQEVVPLDRDSLREQPDLSTLAGRIAESIVGALFGTVHGLDIAHLPERSGEPEVDFILTIGTRRIPVEVKYQSRVDPFRDTEGLRTFMEKTANNAPFSILVTQTDVAESLDPRIVPISLPTLMLLR